MNHDLPLVTLELPNISQTALIHLSHFLQLKNMADSKLKSDVWLYFNIVETKGDKKSQCQLCDALLSYKSNSTTAMWNHLKSKHENAINKKTEESTIKEAFGKRKSFQPSNAAFSTKFALFSKEKHIECYKSAAEVFIFSVLKQFH